MCAATSTVLRAVAVKFFFNCWYLEVLLNNHIRHVPRRVHYHAQGLQLKMIQNLYVGSRSRVPELYPISPDWSEYGFRDEKFVACCEVWLLPSCFCFAKMCLCQVSLLSRCSRRYLTSSLWGSCTLFMWMEGHISLQAVKVMRVDLEPLAFILNFFKPVLNCK
jgi:hypothetical protein